MISLAALITRWIARSAGVGAFGFIRCDGDAAKPSVNKHRLQLAGYVRGRYSSNMHGCGRAVFKWRIGKPALREFQSVCRLRLRTDARDKNAGCDQRNAQ
jgi:hypothetical protein